MSDSEEGKNNKKREPEEVGHAARFAAFSVVAVWPVGCLIQTRYFPYWLVDIKSWRKGEIRDPLAPFFAQNIFREL